MPRAAARGRVGIIGPGRAGLGLALALRRAGWTVLGVHGRRWKRVPRGVRLTTGPLPPWLDDADIVLLAVRDDALPALVRWLARAGGGRAGQAVLHLSGALTFQVLAPLGAARGAALGSIHPLMSLSTDPRDVATRLTRATFAVDGDAAGLAAARRLARAVGGAGRSVRVPAAARARYHAGAVFASNYIVTTLAAAEALLMASGFGEGRARAALAPLARASLEHALAAGPVRALTGPVARGDAATIRRHLAALPARLRRAYAASGMVALALAELGGLNARAAGRVRRALLTRRA